MSPVLKVILGSIFVPLLGIAYFLVDALPPYIPSKALADAAQSSASVASAQERMFDLLKECAPHGDFTPADLPTRLAVVRSFENDVGLFGTTRIDCTDARCWVSATAVIAHAARPDTCGGSHRRSEHRGRRRGSADWLSK